MSIETELYDVLGVLSSASPDAIKKAYRGLAFKFHPDRNPGDSKAEDSFKKINRAHEILSDASKRALYDEFGEMGLTRNFDPRRHRQHKNQSDFHRSVTKKPKDDVFGQQKPPKETRTFVQRYQFGHRLGVDIEGDLPIDFWQAVKGGDILVSMGRRSFFARISPGTASGSRFKVPGLGLPIHSGGHLGDLWLTIQVKPCSYAWIERGELQMKVVVSPQDAWNGRWIELQTPVGDFSVKLPERMQSGQRIRVPGRGIPGESPGTLVLHVTIAQPVEQLPEKEEVFGQLPGYRR